MYVVFFVCVCVQSGCGGKTLSPRKCCLFIWLVLFYNHSCSRAASHRRGSLRLQPGLNLPLHFVFPFVSERVAGSRWCVSFAMAGQSRTVGLARGVSVSTCSAPTGSAGGGIQNAAPLRSSTRTKAATVSAPSVSRDMRARWEIRIPDADVFTCRVAAGRTRPPPLPLSNCFNPYGLLRVTARLLCSMVKVPCFWGRGLENRWLNASETAGFGFFFSQCCQIYCVFCEDLCKYSGKWVYIFPERTPLFIFDCY